MVVVSAHATSAPQECSFEGNEIRSNPCTSGTTQNPFCHVDRLNSVEGTDRVIWDGSFSHTDSACNGPGGRWTGETLQSAWNPITRRVEVNGSGDGELVLYGGIDTIQARVFGQSFAQAATYWQGSVDQADVVVTTNNVIRLSFTASIVDGPKNCSLTWVKVRLGAPNPDFDPESPNEEHSYLLVDSDIDQAGDNALWHINNALQGEFQCSLDLDLSEVDSEDCSIDISDWIPMIQFCVLKNNRYDNIKLRIDDIEMTVAEGPYADPINLVQFASQCVGIGGNDFPSWTLITGEHWSGGGIDNTTGISAMPKACLADTNDDGAVDVGDLLAVIGGWGPLTEFNNAADINCDQDVNVQDLLSVLSGWGTLCP